MVDLGWVEDFPLPDVDVAALVAMLTVGAGGGCLGAALVNAVAAAQQAINMLQAAAGHVRARARGPHPGCVAARPGRAGVRVGVHAGGPRSLFLRAWGTDQYPALGDAWAAGAIEARKIDVILDEVTKAGAGLVAGDRDVRGR